MRKPQLRKHFLKLRESLSYDEWLEKSKRICEILINSEYFQRAKKIAFYYPIKKEVSPLFAFERAIKTGKEAYFPYTHLKAKKLTFHRVFDLKELVPGTFNIPEPPLSSPEIKPLELDLILVPGLAFDREKGRLGYGGGFYDRVLKDISKGGPLKIGLAFSFQVIERLPLEPFDVKMDFILTEEGFI